MPQISGGNRLLDAEAVLSKLKLTSGMKVADFGCGSTGHFSIPAARLVGENGLVYPVDILKSVLDGVEGRARLEGVTNIETVWSNLEIYGATKIIENSLDAVLLINIVLHIKDKEGLIKEALRLLKAGGKILIIDWKPSGGPSFSPAPERRVDRAVIKKIMLGLRIDQIDEFEASEFHYGLIFKKV